MATTIELTSKKYKAQLVASATLTFIFLFFAVISQKLPVVIIDGLFALWYLVTKVRVWWDHA